MNAAIYRKLGVRPVINAAATLTRLGGSLIAPPAVEAMVEAAGHFIDLGELHRGVGARLAELTRNEAGYVSCGAAAGITLAVASCMTGTNPDLVESFPSMKGVSRTEVAIFRGHRNPYDYAARHFGAEVVEFDATSESLRATIGSRTACVLWFAGAHYAAGAPEFAEVLEVARNRGVPVLVDAAAQIPPIASLWHYTAELGADAVLVSGGKGLRGPQSSGLVLGRRDIIEGCRMHGCPNHAIGRSMKVGKEELLGLLTAVETALDQDETALLAAYERTVERWIEGLRDLPGVTVTRGYPSEAGQPHGRALLRLAPDSGWTREALVDALWDRDPRIAVGLTDDAIALNPQTLAPGEDRLVLQALHELLRP
ncbi:aminotransferase class V-fold PLP-dependent enzyme [Saccharopolyspora sp. K220]|uniref:aminotransferase class V-fold PLP-dependent enzyme n=1 Tax=Saccharopolyspora soli TaxID=2926618 RepID=UPI001F5A6CF9|nr:aminotransferase class V-fold PLP-dependent enzyme [Saccharopolyspora soli]MCI2417323.1 aminotransferase class V-fold PLP-dependent enzyme [Saccharopolyspora soli]